jgi:hypothetical protein
MRRHILDGGRSSRRSKVHLDVTKVTKSHNITPGLETPTTASFSRPPFSPTHSHVVRHPTPSSSRLLSLSSPCAAPSSSSVSGGSHRQIRSQLPQRAHPVAPSPSSSHLPSLFLILCCPPPSPTVAPPRVLIRAPPLTGKALHPRPVPSPPSVKPLAPGRRHPHRLPPHPPPF